MAWARWRRSRDRVAEMKKRADVLLVEAGLVESRQRGQALILAGKVFCGDRRIDKAGESLPVDAVLRVKGQEHPYVSRGGVKLEGALRAFGLDPGGLVVADFGASTGGFTDCLLQRGAAHVYAVDVGYGQLADRLRRDSRVTNMERTNARHLTAGDLPRAMDWVVIDASFISLHKLLPAAKSLLCRGGLVLAMVKPQFEVGKERVGKGGVVRDEAARSAAIEAVKLQAKELGLEVRGQADAVLTGPKGNREHFLWLQ